MCSYWFCREIKLISCELEFLIAIFVTFDTCVLPITNDCLQFFDLVILFQHFEIVAQFVFGWICTIVAYCAHFVLFSSISSKSQNKSDFFRILSSPPARECRKCVYKQTVKTTFLFCNADVYCDSRLDVLTFASDSLRTHYISDN